MLLLRNDVNSLPNYLGFLTGMSKFFKWLKKDKQQEESPVDKKPSIQTTDEQVNTESEFINNNNSESSQSITKTDEITQSEQTNSTDPLPPQVHTQRGAETGSTAIENNHSYIISDSDKFSKKGPELVEPKSKLETDAAFTESSIENAPLTENTLMANNEPAVAALEKPFVEPQDTEKSSLFGKLKRGLSRTKESIGSGIDSLFRGKAIDDELFEELETQLLLADVGMDTTVKIIKQLTESSDRKQLKDGDTLYQLLKEQMADILRKVESPLTLKTESGPFVILMVGVNGVGKTTTTGKMAKQFQQHRYAAS